MSIVALGMNLFLAVLLMAAMVMGWRLERRLRGVRDSHAVFAQAVGDLDAATARAQAGLAELRAATDEAIDLLGGRISRAREACERLDRSLSQADVVARRAETAPRRAEPAAAPPPARAAAPTAPKTEAAAPEAGRRLSVAQLQELLELAKTTRLATGVGQRPAAPRRPRAADDDLFDDNFGAAA